MVKSVSNNKTKMNLVNDSQPNVEKIAQSISKVFIEIQNTDKSRQN